MVRRLMKIKEKHKEYHFEESFDFNGFFEEEEIYQKILAILLKMQEGKEFDSYKVSFSWPKDLGDAEREHLKYSMQHRANLEFGEKAGKKVDFSSSCAIFLVDFNKKAVFLRLEPVYLSGSYCKFSRVIAQTEYFCNKCKGHGCWYCKNTGHFSEESVEQLLGAIFLKYFKGKDIILHGAGREDMDVLMLGNGRPFIMEVISPIIRSVDLVAVENEINYTLEGKVQVNSLKFVKKDEVSLTKDTHHDKIYLALVKTNKEVSSQILGQLVLNKEFDIIQTTPKRVERRRTMLDRAKKITLQKVEFVDTSHFYLTLKTSHGTYVKEFISGDEERTKPSIASMIGSTCSCEQLDVLEIC